jgi:UDP-2,3-diacylglucosamine hydrolase
VATSTVPALAVEQSAAPLTNPVFISDLHLTPQRPVTVQRFLRFMREDAPRYRELAILGDLFEFWLGDDAGSSAEPVINALTSATQRGQHLVLMHGNRDPLLGVEFCRATGARLLADPIVVEVAATPTLLSHGDLWCTRDLAYQRFRAMTRDPVVQADFLSKSIDERLAFMQDARSQSAQETSNKPSDIMDVTPAVVCDALRAAGVHRVIHGHTHRPAAHEFDLDGALAERWVLPDWDLDAADPRGGFLDFQDGAPRLVFFDD